MWNSTGCPSNNAEQIHRSAGVNWDAHRIGWAISGCCAIVTLLITTYSVLRYTLNYRVPNEQRQVIRILYMPPIFSIISFFSYRFFCRYTYYSVSEVVYEAIVISAFMFLLIESVASTADEGTAHAAMLKKDKNKLSAPFCCWRYRPSKAYFMYTVKWAVMQYTVIQPAISLISVITQSFNLLCVSSFSPQFVNLYLTIFSFLSNSLAVYGLVVFYELTKRDLKGRRPAAKFWCVNIIVSIPFLQQVLFSVLQGAGVVKGNKFWTATDVADGLNALTTCFEMIIFSLFMIYAFPVSEYKGDPRPKHSMWKALWDSVNYWDFVIETYKSLKFFIDYARDKPGTRSHIIKSSNSGERKGFSEVFTNLKSSSLLKLGSDSWKRVSKVGLPWSRSVSTVGTEESGEARLDGEHQMSMVEIRGQGSVGWVPDHERINSDTETAGLIHAGGNV